MRSISLSKLILMSLVRQLHIILLGASAGVTWNNFYNVYLGSPYRGNNLGWLLLALYLVLLYVFSQLYGAYRIGNQRLNMVIYSNWLSMFMTNAVIFPILFLIRGGRLPVLPIIALTAFDTGIILTWAYFANKIYFRIFPPRKVVCFYEGEYPTLLVKKINERKEKFQLTGAYLFDGRKNIEKYTNGADALIFYNLSEEKSAKLMRFCIMRRLRYYLFPTIGDILLRTSETMFLFDTPLFIARNEGLSLRQRFCKRMFDIIFSLLLIIAASPVMFIIALLVRSDGGPAIYKQTRCTKDGLKFEILKFRSMVENAEERGAVLAGKDDPRITKIGKIIRKYRLDELPQLFNVLNGEMSLVGPRPERPDFIAQYSNAIPEFTCRMNVKCGLTGYAQVMGRYDTSPEDKLKLDLFYIQSYSIIFDIKILFMTVKIILFDSQSSSGIDLGRGPSEI